MKNYLFYVCLMGLMLVGPKAFAVDYQLPDLHGKTQSLDQYRGKWVIVNFWATWCSSCIKELPELAAIHKKHKDSNIVVVGINHETIKNDQLKGFVTAYDIPYPVWRSKDVPVTPLGPVPALPTNYIIDPEGKVVAGEVGVMTQQTLEDYINRQQSSKKYVKYAVQ